MKPIAGYENIQGSSDFTPLPKDGYVLDIKQAKEITDNGNPYIEVMFDIAEGEYKDYYKNNYDAQSGEDKKWRGRFRLYEPLMDGSEKDTWTQKTFKTFTNSLEDSNEGYHWDWDESKWAGKKIGGLFRYKDYQKNDGSTGMVTEFKRATSVEKIRSGNFTLPDDYIRYGGSASSNDTGDFAVVTSEEGSDLPWD